jgi:copper chaperone NosL
MKNIHKVILIIGSLGLFLIFFFPIWKITLVAPQYPEGVTMLIYINKIGGTTAAALQNINILNHYIGMKAIVPESIPELVYFPYVIYGLIFLGVGTALINKRSLTLSWVILLVLLGLAGVYDFYLWEYDYGHNLAPNAPLKFPGASFQPPLFGSKQIINFTAISLPATGIYFYGLAIISGIYSWWKFKK